MHKYNLRMHQEIPDTIVFTERNNANTLYYHHAMKAPEANEFQNAIIKEANAHVKRKQWEIITR